MRVELKYEKGYVYPRLDLTDQEHDQFRTLKLEPYITYNQIIQAFEEETSSLYMQTNDKCSLYCPRKKVTKKSLREASDKIYNLLLQQIKIREKAPIMVSVGDPLPPGSIDELFEILPDGESEIITSNPDYAYIVVGDKFFQLVPFNPELKTIVGQLKREYNESLKSTKTIYSQILESWKREMERRFDSLKQRYNEIIPVPKLDVTRIAEHGIAMFTICPSPEQHGGGKGNFLYLQIPFKLRQQKIRIEEILYKIREEYQINMDGYLTLALTPSGSISSHWLSQDREVSKPMRHAHTMSKYSFCKGSYKMKNYNLLGEGVLSQLIEDRDNLERTFEVMNSGSLGSFPPRISGMIDVVKAFKLGHHFYRDQEFPNYFETDASGELIELGGVFRENTI